MLVAMLILFMFSVGPIVAIIMLCRYLEHYKNVKSTELAKERKKSQILEQHMYLIANLAMCKTDEPHEDLNYIYQTSKECIKKVRSI